MTDRNYMAELEAPFTDSDLEWKPQVVNVDKQDGKPDRWWLQIVPFVSARAICRRLDQVFGIDGWQFTVRPIIIGKAEGCVGTLMFRVKGGEWITREDVAEPSDIEPLKGAVSGAIKRVAVTLGIGRGLYDMDAVYGVVHEGGKHRAIGKTKKGIEYNFKWDVPPKVLVKTTGQAPDVKADANGEVIEPKMSKSVPKAPTPTGDAPKCPKCTGPMFDNREGKKNPKSPDFKCKDKSCTGLYWPGQWPPKAAEEPGLGRTATQPGLETDVPLFEDDFDDDQIPYWGSK